MTGDFTLGSDSKEVREYLKPTLILIAEAFEGAIPVVLDSIKQQGLDFSPFLFSTSVRCHLKKALQKGGYNPQDLAEPTPYALHSLSNDGIEFRNGHLIVKVLKGSSLPRATSWNREVFYSQQGEFDFQKENYLAAPLRSVVVLWDYELAMLRLSLLLVAPKTSAGEMLWQLPVPSPAEWISTHDTLDSRDEDLNIRGEEEEDEEGEQGE